MHTCTWAYALPHTLVCTNPHTHTHRETPGHAEEIGKIGICFDDSTGQIKHMSIRDVLEECVRDGGPLITLS